MAYGVVANIQIRIFYLSISYQKTRDSKCVTVLLIVLHGCETLSPTIMRNMFKRSAEKNICKKNKIILVWWKLHIEKLKHVNHVIKSRGVKLVRHVA